MIGEIKHNEQDYIRHMGMSAQERNLHRLTGHVVDALLGIPGLDDQQCDCSQILIKLGIPPVAFRHPRELSDFCIGTYAYPSH